MDKKTGIPYVAIGNSEPLPEGLPPSILRMIRESRREAGWCDHGNRLDECPEGCT